MILRKGGDAVFGGIFDELFAPGRKHLTDERNRLELTKDEEGDAAGGKGVIDLDSGVVVVRKPRQEPGTSPS